MQLVHRLKRFSRSSERKLGRKEAAPSPTNWPRERKTCVVKILKYYVWYNRRGDTLAAESVLA